MTRLARQIRSASGIRLARHTAHLTGWETLEEDKSEMCSPSEDVVSSRAQRAQSR